MGTRDYASPQIMADRPFSAKADIYSVFIYIYVDRNNYL